MTRDSYSGYFLPIKERRLDNIYQDFRSTRKDDIIPRRCFTLRDYSNIDIVTKIIEYNGTNRDAYVYSLPTNVKNELLLPIRLLTNQEKEVLLSHRSTLRHSCNKLLNDINYKRHGRDIWINQKSETISHFVRINLTGNSIKVSFGYSFTWRFSELEKLCPSDRISDLVDIFNRFLKNQFLHGRPIEYLSFTSANMIYQLIPCDTNHEITSILGDINQLLMKIVFPFVNQYKNIFDIYDAYRSSLANADAWGVPSHINLAYCYVLQKRYSLAIAVIDEFKSILKASKAPLPFVHSQNARGLRKSFLLFCDIILEGLYGIAGSSNNVSCHRS